MIYRHIDEYIDDCVNHYPVTLLSGPRQIGKSTLIFNKYINKGFKYVELSDLTLRAFAKNDPKGFLEAYEAPLIIDEAQKAPELFPEIEKIVNKARLEKGNKEANGMYILSGSERKKLLERSRESLAGRVALVDMSNLSMNEILIRENRVFDINFSEIIKRNKNYEVNDIYDYIFRGFFPALYDDLTQKENTFYRSYIATYLEKDLKDLIDVNDEVKFLNFLKVLASNTGQELIYENYSKIIGAATNTIKSWVNALVISNIIYLLEPYNEESIVKRIVKRPKLYFFDTGLVCYLCDIDSKETLKKHFLKGRIFETFIMNEIKKTYINAGISKEFYYYRDTNQNEIDLILINKGSLSCVEIKAGDNFGDSDVKAFKIMNDTRLERGKDCIISGGNDITSLKNNVYIFPFKVI